MQYYYEANADVSDYCYLRRQKHPFADSHFHSANEMIIVRSGRMLAVIDGVEHELSAGKGCFVGNLTVHAYREIESDTEVYVLVGDGRLWSAVFQDVGGVPPTSFDFSDFGLLDRAVELFEAQNARIGVFKGLISLVCASISVKNKLGPGKERGEGFDLAPVLYYIDEHFRERITLTDLSRRFGYSPQYFSKTFHRRMRVNLTEYINAKRVGFARSLLISDKSVAEVAYLSGFNSTVSFYRAYKKAFNKLPRD